MKLLDSLLDAIVRLEGDALVMHVGEKPYVVTTSAAMSAYRGPLAWGQVELSSRVLTPEAVHSMLMQILPAEHCRTLDEVGAVEHEIAAPAGVRDRFTVVAARGGDDIWLEVRRQPAEVPEPAAAEAHPALVSGAGVSASVSGATGTTDAPAAPAPVSIRTDAPHVPHEAAVVRRSADEREGAGVAGPKFPVRQLEERRPVLDEVGAQQPERVEHVVIPVERVEPPPVEPPVAETPSPPLEEAREPFELVGEVPQEAPSETEVDELLAATASALLTSGLGAEIESVEEDANLLPLESATLDTELAAALAEAGSDEEWIEASVEEITITASGGPTAGRQEAPAASEPADEPMQQSAGEPGPLPGSADADAKPLEPAALADGDTADHVPATPSEPALASGAPAEAAPPEPVAEAPPGVDAVEVAADRRPEPGAPAAAALPSEFPATPSTPEEPAKAVAEAAVPPVESAIPEAAAAASVLPPAPAAEPRLPVSESLSERHPAAGAQAPGAFQETGAAAGRPTVVPMGRGPARAEAGHGHATLQSALRTAAARGASTVYLVAQSKPAIRVNGEISILENQAALGEQEIEGLIATLTPPQHPARPGAELEWMSDVPDVGRVRCLTFRDHRGPGVIFRMDHVGLPPEVRSLAGQADGLVLIAGPHASGKSTLLNAFIDQINVNRGDHVITLESHIGFVHESRRSFISQRELGDDPARAAAAARAVLREDPDVLVIEDLQSAELAAAALEAAESGRLVFATLSAPSAVAAVDQFLEAFPAERRGRAARSLSGALRGVVSQVLVRRASGGRVPAREVLLNTSSVASAIREGRTKDLQALSEATKAPGIVSMTEALLALVRDKSVQPVEAWRKANDRTTLLERFKREGVDTAFADRLV
ncbi:MAG TPA: ATPase, T2SS/T4P/T4SS family [Vicinamibacterales bacterium]|nr:ATPase, T2SS/T4P/T4SS family [Vicinamibacterales bacterium]